MPQMIQLPLMSRVRVAGKALLSVFDSAATTGLYGMMSGILPGGSRGDPPQKGTRQMLEAYSDYPWLRATTERASDACAAVTWRLYLPTSQPVSELMGKRPVLRTRVTINGRKFMVPTYQPVVYRTITRKSRPRIVQRSGLDSRRKSLEELADSDKLLLVEDHPMLDLLEGANSYLVGIALRKLLFIYTFLVGNVFWLLQRGPEVINGRRGAPTSAWPIPPDWIAETPTPSRRKFRVSFRGWQGEIDEEDILWFADPNPSNPYGLGTGLAKSLADELDTDEQAAKHLKSFFWNRGRPDLVVSGEGLTDTTIQQFEDSWWANLRRGLAGYNKPFFTDHEVKIQELGQTFDEMQMVPLREHERNTIHQVFGIPPEMLGINQQANRSTSEAADYHMAKYVLTPRLEFVREVFQERLAPQYDERLIVDYDSPVMEDKEFRLKAMQAKPETPKVDEWREVQGLEPLGEGKGDIHLVNGSAVVAVKELIDLELSDEPPPDPNMPALPPGESDPNAAAPPKPGDAPAEEDAA